MTARDWHYVVIFVVVTAICVLAHVRHTCVAGLFGATCHQCPERP